MLQNCGGDKMGDFVAAMLLISLKIHLREHPVHGL